MWKELFEELDIDMETRTTDSLETENSVESIILTDLKDSKANLRISTKQNYLNFHLTIAKAVSLIQKLAGYLKIEKFGIEYELLTLFQEELDFQEKLKFHIVHFKGGLHQIDEKIVSNFMEVLDSRKFIFDGKCSSMEPWKNATGIFFPNTNEFQRLDIFYHLSSLRLRLKELNSHEARKLITNFTNKTSFEPRTTFFQIFTENTMIPEEILAENNNFLKSLVTDKREENFQLIRVQKLPMLNSANLVFVVKATPTMLAGTVCRSGEELLDDDFLDPPLL